MHGYRSIENEFYGQNGSSATCNIDIACRPDFEQESKAVGLVLLSSGTEWCSGSLIMSTDCSLKPYFLTAFHCIDYTKDGTLSVDEIDNAENWMFKFYHKKIECNESSIHTGYTYNSDTFRAGWNSTDFALVEINGTINYNNLTLLGWDRTGVTPTSGNCIHHPCGDIMKINTINSPFNKSSWNGTNNHWYVNWDEGVTQGGSSGAPFLDQNKHIVGQNHGKLISQDNLSLCERNRSDGGMFHLSWTGGGSDSTRLSNWLDPYNTGVTVMPSSFDINIFGENKIYNSNVYTTFSMSNGYSVNWSLSGANASCYTVHNNTPSTNQCTVTLKDSVDFVNTNDLVLNAQIKYGSTVITTVTKPLTPVYIYGPTVPYSTEMYEVNNLPDDCTVSWNWSGTGLTIDNTPVLVEPYYSTNNYFKLVRNNLDYARGTLTATINRSGNTVATISKTLDTGVNFSGTWYQGLNSPSTLTCGNTYAISGSQVVLQSDNFIGRTMTYSCNGMLLFGGVSHSGNTISFTPILPALKGDEPNANPGFGSSVTINVTDATTHEAFKFTFYIEPQHPLNPPILSMAVSGNEYTFTIDEASESRQAWTLEVVKIDTGQQVYSGTTDNASQTVRTSNWQSGIYAALVRRNGQIVATQKMTIK